MMHTHGMLNNDSTTNIVIFFHSHTLCEACSHERGQEPEIFTELPFVGNDMQYMRARFCWFNPAALLKIWDCSDPCLAHFWGKHRGHPSWHVTTRTMAGPGPMWYDIEGLGPWCTQLKVVWLHRISLILRWLNHVEMSHNLQSCWLMHKVSNWGDGIFNGCVALCRVKVAQSARGAIQCTAKFTSMLCLRKKWIHLLNLDHPIAQFGKWMIKVPEAKKSSCIDHQC